MINSNINTIPGNVRSYDLGKQPFKHDVGRGKWESIWDFYAVALSHSFGFRHLALFFLLSYMRNSNIVWLFMAYLLGMFILVLPLYYIQLFMGQFSSSGLISAFRIAPLFKIIGYVSLFLNVMTSTYLMISAAFPLSIVFDSMQLNLPWAHCNNSYNTENCSMVHTDDANIENTFPIDEYYKYITRTTKNSFYAPLLWRIILCSFFGWFLIGVVLSKGVELFGKIFRFITITSLICIMLTTIRILCTQGSLESISYLFDFHIDPIEYLIYIAMSPLLTITIFGTGWGNLLTMASYNNFKTNIRKTSLIVCIVQMIIFLLALVSYQCVHIHYKKFSHHRYLRIKNLDVISRTFKLYALYFSELNWPNFWTVIFFFPLFLTQFAEGAIQILSILTAIFDEFEYTRIYKKIILWTLVTVFGLCSIIFCNRDVISSITSLYLLAAAYKAFIISIELFIILWVYGRLRFQRDVKFMTGKTFQTWIIWIIRILTPIFALFSFVMFLIQSFFFGLSFNLSLTISFLVIKAIPILCIPGYIIYKINTTSGNILNRIRFLSRPNDWYPADPIEHQNYENYLGNSDIANELVHDDGNT